MDLSLKRRLLGALVLILLAIIFLPMLFEPGLKEVDFEPLPEAELALVPSQKPLPSAWAVQVGAATDLKSAQALQDRLRAAHFAAFVVEAGGGRYLVKVGPTLDKNQAEVDAAAIKQHLDLDAVVVSHPD